jgi:ubiquinone/menaquinone biosynthesis C-methylase UbiE
MSDIILRPNAIPVYGFLSAIAAGGLPVEGEPQLKILDCGAGGPVPPVALFAQQGFEAFGMDIDPEQLERARQFCEAQNIDVDLRQGDMRALPFGDESFDYVFEHYAMCHLSKEDTVKAISEMQRVLKPGGMAFWGVISTDCWPKSFFGEERIPGEFWIMEDGELARHSMFTDAEADALVSGWKIESRQKQVRYLREAAQESTLAEWMNLLSEQMGRCTQDDWRARYKDRTNAYQYVHLYYILEKK